MKITHDKQFKDRAELEAFVRTRFGDDVKENKDSEIELTQEEADKFLLSDKTTVFGVKCKVLKAK